jgi:hypothetical protein
VAHFLKGFMKFVLALVDIVKMCNVRYVTLQFLRLWQFISCVLPIFLCVDSRLPVLPEFIWSEFISVSSDAVGRKSVDVYITKLSRRLQNLF